MPSNNRLCCAIALLISAGIAPTGCSDTSAASLHVRVDTLPGGILRTVTEQPVDSGRWTLVADLDVQPPELGAGELLDPADLALAEDGSVIVADRKPAAIKVYASDGRFVRAFGTEGSGPGEFRAAYIAVVGDTLVVQDPRNGRATTFNWRTGAMLSERRTACCYYAPIAVDGSGRVVVRATTPSPDTALRNAQAFVRFAPNGTAADTVFIGAQQAALGADPWLVRDGDLVRMAVMVPYQPSLALAVDPRGGFVSAWTGEYVIRRTRAGADTTALFGRRFTPTVVTAEDKQRLVNARIASMRLQDPSGPSEEVLRASFDPARIPNARPAFEQMRVDGAGRLWVRRADSDSSVVRFDLFDVDGRWLDVLEVPGEGWPRDLWGPTSFAARAAAVVIDGSDGRPLVRVYRIERRGER
jgi:hypothetical protein